MIIDEKQSEELEFEDSTITIINENGEKITDLSLEEFVAVHNQQCLDYHKKED